MLLNILKKTIFSQSNVKNTVNLSLQRNLFAYLRIAFNKVDEARLAEVGPDRLCAEWVIKNGGCIKFWDAEKPIAEYNVLQTPGFPYKLKIQTIDATDSSIMALGFDHLKNCTDIRTIILNRCKHLENEALEKLAYVKDSLNELQITECGNIENSGLLSLKQLQNLQKLTIHSFLYVQDFDGIVKDLQKNLPNCKILTSKPEENN